MNGKRAWGAVLAGVGLVAVAAWCGCRRGEGPENGVILLKQTPAAGSVLRNQDRILWEWSDAMAPLYFSSSDSTGEVTVTPPMPGRIEWLAPSAMAFTPDRPWPDTSNILVKVALPPSLAGRPFKPLYTLFHGEPPPATPVADDSMSVKSVDPEEERDAAAIRIVFAQPPAPGWTRFVKVDPSTNLVWESGTGTLARIRGLVPGTSVELTFLPGLPALNGSVLTQEFYMVVQFPDLGKRLRFQDKGHYLSTAGSRTLALETVNLTAVRVSAWKIYANNIPEFARSSSLYASHESTWGTWNQADSLGDEITNRVYKLGTDKNVVRRTLVDLRELAGGADSGLVYVMAEAVDADSRMAVHRTVILTDLGLTVIRSEKEVLVWALSIGKGSPVAGVTVNAYSTKNQLVGSAVTDERGLARFTLDKGSAMGLVTGVKGTAFAMLDTGATLIQGPVSETGYGFLGSGYEAFLYADRGIYRPGETLHIRAVVRGPLMACPPPFPVQLTIRRPDGGEAARLTAMLSDAGTAEFAWPCPVEALTGNYGLTLEAGAGGRTAGSLSVMVEDFVPPTLAVTLKGPTNRVALAKPVKASIEARHLFGSPAGGKRADLRARLGPAPFQPAGFPGYVFGDPRRDPVWRTIECGEKRLDAKGLAGFEVNLPEGLNPGGALACTLVATVIEDSGRACPAVLTFPVDVHSRYIGLKPLEGSVVAGTSARFKAVMVTPDGAPVENEPLAWTLSRVTWIWRQETDSESGSRFKYDRLTEPVRDGTLTPAPGGVADMVWEHALEGEYELTVSETSGASVAACSFYVSGGSWGDGAGFRQPDKVSVRFDKDQVRAGEDALVTVQAPFPGLALITLENDGIRETRVLAMAGKTLEFKIPVKPEYGPNVYVRAVVVRPQDGSRPEQGLSVVRATGQASLKVVRPEAVLKVGLSVPERLKPAVPFTAEVTVTDAAGRPVSGEVTVSAVDEGILQLTGYKTPDPLGFFSTPRDLDSRLYDGYSLLLPDPGAMAAAARMKTGGDAMGAEMAGRLNPIRARRFTPVALWSGTLKTGPDGKAAVTFRVPEFSGQLRVTAVAAGVGGFGSASKAVTIRRDWVVQAGLPRAAAPGDTIAMTCQVFNEGAAAGEADLRVTAAGALAGSNAHVRVALAPGENRAVTVPLKGLAAGVGTVRLAVEAAGDRWEESIEIPVRPPWPLVTLAGIGALAPGQAATLDLPGDWISNWGTGRLACSGSPGLEKMGALDFLDEYPHGCLEQTLSKAFPYLVAADLMAASGQGYRNPAVIRERVMVGVRGVLSMQTGGGGFSLWPREAEVYDWGTAYAVLFLAKAREAGYAVPQEALDRACVYLEQRLAGWLRDDQPQGLAYSAAALTALGAAGRPDQAALTRLQRQEELMDYDTDAWMIQALLASGRRGEAATWLEQLGELFLDGSFREVGGALSSSIRIDALLLDAWLQVNPDSPQVPFLVNRLLQSQDGGSWGTTQDNAWSLLALGRFARLRPPGPSTCTGVAASADGKQAWTLSETNGLAFGEPTGLKKLTIRNTGKKYLYFSWNAAGVPSGGKVPEEDSQITIRRQVLALNGEVLDGKRFKQGDLAIVQLKISGMTDPLDNLVIEELLPGGLEIENPLLPNGYASFLPQNDPSRLSIRYMTIRDDRLVAFTGLVGGVGNLHYLVRAVTPGDYIWPPATVACMYEPSIHSLHGGGHVTVEP